MLLGKIRDLPYIDTTILVDVGNFLSAQEKGIVTLELPGYNCSLTGQTQGIAFTNTSDFTWVGKLQPYPGCDSLAGDFSFVFKGGEFTGTISAEERLFSIFHLKNGISVLGEHAGVGLDYGCLVEDTTQVFSGNEDLLGYRTTGIEPCIIDILVFYSEDADAFEPLDVVARAEEFMAYTRQALLNSRIWTTQVRFNLLGVEKISGFMESEGFVIDAFEQTHDNFRTNNFVDGRINDTGADIAVLLTKVGTSLGISGGGPSSIAKATVGAFGGDSRVTFAHEVAHAFDCRHQLCSVFSETCSTEPNDRHAHRFEYKLRRLFSKKRTYATIVHGGSLQGAIPIANYSNPDVKFYGDAPTGVTGQSDNANTILQNSCLVAGANSLPNTYYGAFISGPDEGCPGVPATFSAVIQNIPGSFTVEWAVSEDGITYSTVLQESGIDGNFNNLPDLTITPPNQAGTVLFIRFHVTSSQSTKEATVYHTLTVIDDPMCPVPKTALLSAPPAFEFPEGGAEVETSVEGPFPNPSMGRVEMKIYLSSEKQVSISLIDLNSRVIAVPINQQYASGINLVLIDTQNIRPGMYFIKTDVGGETYINKIVVTQ